MRGGWCALQGQAHSHPVREEKAKDLSGVVSPHSGWRPLGLPCFFSFLPAFLATPQLAPMGLRCRLEAPKPVGMAPPQKPTLTLTSASAPLHQSPSADWLLLRPAGAHRCCCRCCRRPPLQVVYILDQVRALEREMTQRLEDAGLQVGGRWRCGADESWPVEEQRCVTAADTLPSSLHWQP
jgi:hypothetical protein